jgi:pimeloyl-ACP methyl ester carboxylesterase
MAARYAMLHPDRVTGLVLVGSLYPRRDPHMNTEIPGAAARRDAAAARALAELRTAGVETSDPERFCREYWRVEGPMTVGDPASLASRTWPCDLPNERPKNTSAWGAGVFRSLGAWDWTAEARTVTAPALVIHGDLDAMVPRASSEEWARVLPNSRLHVLSGAGHIPWWEHADRIFPLIDGFLQSLPPRSPW